MIRLRTLGAVELRGPDGQPLDPVLTQPKRLALLFYLAAAGGYHRRDTLFGLLWRDTDQSQARAALNQAVYFLRRELGRETIRSRGNDEVAVDASRLACDVAAFDAALEAGDRQAALELYGGELLPGFFLSDAPGWERWLDGQRDGLRVRAASAARGLADEAFAAGDAAEAVRWARRTVDIVPYDELELRRLLSLLARIGDRAGATAAYEKAAARFAGEYEGELSVTTRGLMERIHAGKVEEIEVAEVWPTPPVAVAAPAGAGPPARDSRPAASGRRRKWAALAWVALALGLAALLAIGALQWRDAGAPDGPAGIAAPPERLAVLPLDGSSLEQPERAYLADALSEGLIRRLSEVAGLGVIAWTSVESYRAERPSAAEIGDRLQARYLFEGILEPAGPAGERVRLEARLTEAATGQAVWSRRYELAPEDVAAAQGGIVVDVTRALSVDIDTSERERLQDPGTEDPDARRAYLEGRYLLGKTDEASFRAALARFRGAIDRDPTYALAWSGMSDAYDHLAGIGAMSSEEAYARARSAAERALDIDPHLAEAHASLAMALSHHYWMSDDAERHWRRALELKPSDARVRRTYAGHLRNLGRFDEALAQATVARDLDPIPFYSHFELLVIPYFQGRYEDVVVLATRLAAADPGYAYAHFLRALALVQLERYDEALQALEALDPEGTFPDARLIRGYIAGRRGDEAVAFEELRRLEAAADPAARGFERAILHVALDEPDEALAALEAAYDAPQFRLRLLGYEPLFDPLRGDPRFRELLERIGLGEIPPADPPDSRSGSP